MRPTTKSLLTADELLRMPDRDVRHELIRGELRTMTPAGSEHGVITARLAMLVNGFAHEHGLGIVFGAETGFQIASNPDTVRAPDLAFVSTERVPATGIPQGFWRGPPDLAVEVISPSDAYDEVDAKVRDWLVAGSRVVWIINPRSHTVAIHRKSGVTILDENGVLEEKELLPAWICRVADLFP